VPDKNFQLLFDRHFEAVRKLVLAFGSLWAERVFIHKTWQGRSLYSNSTKPGITPFPSTNHYLVYIYIPL
jgi:hypothetical protein